MITFVTFDDLVSPGDRIAGSDPPGYSRVQNEDLWPAVVAHADRNDGLPHQFRRPMSHRGSHLPWLLARGSGAGSEQGGRA